MIIWRRGFLKAWLKKSKKLAQFFQVIYQARDAVCLYQMKDSAQRSIFDELGGVLSGNETLCRMLDITSKTK